MIVFWCVLLFNVLFVPLWCLSLARVNRLRSLREGIEHVFFTFIA